MDNIHGDIELPADTLRRAINTDIMDSGRLKRRKGFAPVLALSGAHSLWSDGLTAYFVLANNLRLFLENGTSSVVGVFLAGLNRLSGVKVNNDIYLTCKTARGRIRAGVLSPWGVEVPSSAPVLVATVGTMPAGVYYGAVTYLLADGRESGASKLASIILTAAGGIATTSMPIPVDTAITGKRLYLSTPDGEVLFMAQEVAAADQFANIGALASGARLRTEYLAPPPFGSNLAQYNGRIFIVDAADPSVVWFTEAFDYDHVDLRKNYYQFGAPVTIIAAVTDGLYVCADNTYFLPNAGGQEAGQRKVLGFGAVANSMSSIPNTTDVIWMTEHGPAIGKDGGIIELIAEKVIASGQMVEAAALVREKDGVRQFVIVGSTTQASALQAGSYAEAEIIRRSS